MFVGILHRAIFWELAKVFLLSLVGITGIIVMAAIVVEASQRGLGPAQVLGAIPLIVPSMLPFIVPPTTLFATCVVYGRLSHDNEITAIKSAGINIMHVVWPAAVLGAVMSLSTFGLYYYLIPYTHHLLRTAVVNDVEEYLYAMLKKDREIRPPNLNYEMWVGQVQGRQLKYAIFKRRDGKGRYDVIASAREAELRVDLTKREILVNMHHGRLLNDDGKSRLNFDEQLYAVPLPEMDRRKPSARDMTWQEILGGRIESAEKEQYYREYLGNVTSGKVPYASPGEQLKAQKNLELAVRDSQQRTRQLNTELQMRPALSCGCFFFVLVGCPVGIWFSRSDYLSAFITCFMPIVFVYYPLQLCSGSLAKDGKVAPALAMWSANAVLGVMALGLFRRLVKN